MVSRLDRLFILLDTGSNESIRFAAARQLGEVQRVQPNDLNYLLRRIKEYSGKSVWETRVAAGQATKHVLEKLELWPPKSIELSNKDDKANSRLEAANKLIEQYVNTKDLLENFELEEIITLCPKLLSLDIADNDDSHLISPTTSSRGSARGRGSRGRREPRLKGSSRKVDKEQLMRQRKLINKELGIDMVDSLNLDVKSTDIVSNDDLQTEYEIAEGSPTTVKSSLSQRDARTALQNKISNYEKVLDRLLESDCISKAREPTDQTNNTIQYTNDQWPLTEIVKQYTDDLFNPSWEVRHGAAIALREIVRLQGKSAGKRSDLLTSSNNILNQLWLVDMALKALCILALDKFGDFLFDQVVAPVRENAAQLLGCCVAHMTETNAFLTIKIILKMLDKPNWETRHGGILGLKYYLNVIDRDSLKIILQDCFDPIFKCLGDQVDDVSAEAAAALVPVKDLVIEVVPDKTPKLIRFLWDHLASLDELTTSTSNIVLLLASLITSSSAQLELNELTKSIPKLWSLLSHSSTSVRVSVLKALVTLIKSQKSTCLSWMPEELLVTALRLIFQRAILENVEEVRPHLEEVWILLVSVSDHPSVSSAERFGLLKCTSQFLNSWLCLLMWPTNNPIDRGGPMWLNIKPDGSKSETKPDGEVYIGSCTFNAETMAQQKVQVIKCRLLGSRLLGALYANLVNDFSQSEESQHAKESLKYLSDMFIHYIKNKSSNQRMISGWTLESWANHQITLLANDHRKLPSILPVELTNQLNIAIQETNVCYDELAFAFTRLQQDTRNYVAALIDSGIQPGLSTPCDKKTIYNLNQVQILCDMDIEAELQKEAVKKYQNTSHPEQNITKTATFTSLWTKKANLAKSLESTNLSRKNLSTSVLSSLAFAHISWRLLPKKVELIAQPLLDSIEFEEEHSLQDKSIHYLILLFDILSNDLERHSTLLESIINKLSEILNCDTLSASSEFNDGLSGKLNSPRCSIDTAKGNGYETQKIVLLDNLQRKAELSRAMTRRQSSINSTSSLKRSHSLASSIDLENDSMSIQDELARQQQIDLSMTIKLRGASNCLSKLTNHFGQQLPRKLPFFWRHLTEDVKTQIKRHHDDKLDAESILEDMKLLKRLRLVEVVGESLNVKLRGHLLDLYAELILLLPSSNPLIRHHSSQCIGVISKLMQSETIELINKQIIPMLNHDNILARCGSIEAIALIIEHLQLDLVPNINRFVIHVLRRMSDQAEQVRLMATHCFGKLLSLMPLNLEKHKILNSQVRPKLEHQDDQRFIEQLLDPKKLDNFNTPFEMKADLRSYQQDGLNWLAFLNRFNLHGILCDEMGLGKTFMTICMVGSDHFIQKEDVENGSRCPSLIVCPPTLIEHWLYEIEKFIPSKTRSILNPVSYSGSLADRVNLRNRILDSINKCRENYTHNDHNQDGSINLVVSSYDIVRNDIDFFKEVQWNYCVLDEGHIIKNGKTKLSRSIRLINAKHRLILSGTPIQNNVTELWSLFDFLMPGFLGSERQFNSRYTKPILQSRELKCSARESEAGALAMESLHRQVLPFILRRLKEDVLDDLPPKIIQDYYCELSQLQQKLYEDFTRSKLCKDVTRKSIHDLNESDHQDVKADSKSHVFQALQYLKNVCNHPKLVLTEMHPQYKEIRKSLENERTTLDDINHSSKLKALKQLLLDCGIGISSVVGGVGGDEQQQSLAIESVVNQHRALVFCQIRSMVDIIENDLLKKHLPEITYLKLDGSIPTNQRQLIVSRFNNDPSIDILLLTTQIGGLGLNLTGADTVIFVEHDWNPTKDLQAMDRAHRIGQKKVVNVYRLITKDTLEEKIMGLQKFKTMVSNTVINSDNAGLGSMNVDQLFNLFEDTTTSDKDCKQSSDSSGRGKSKSSSFMELLPELWDQQQYETEYDLSSFVSSLKN